MLTNGSSYISHGLYYSGDGGDGGGLFNNEIMILKSTSIISNTTGNGSSHIGQGEYYSGDGGDGGGLYNAGHSLLVNSTISHNETGDALDPDSSGGHGGGIYNEDVLIVENVTIAYNHTGVTFVDGINFAGTGGGIQTKGQTRIHNSIIAGNISEYAGPECSGTLTSIGNNFIQDLNDCVILGNTSSIITSSYTYLFPLADNGGDTWTHALMPGSPAIDAGSCLDSEGITVTVDQRGVARPIGFTCDIGAFEAPEYPKFFLTVVLR